MYKCLYRERGRAIKRKTVSQITKEYRKLFDRVMIVFICVISLLCLFQTNSIATKGYEVGEHEKELAGLKKENQKLLIELADTKSVSNLEGEVDKFSAVDAKDIVYVISESGAVAMKK